MDLDYVEEYDPIYDDPKYIRYCERQEMILRTRERRRCYDCVPITGRVRRVVSKFVVAEHFDPTQAYNLTCGHAAIDC